MLTGAEKVAVMLQVLPWAIVIFGALVVYAKYEGGKTE